jgi:organic radical activating enzyme
MDKKTARVIITFDCERSCDYCCNKYKSLMDKGIHIDDIVPLFNYDEICITGGEPMLYPERTLTIIKRLKQYVKQTTKIYLYTAKYVNNSNSRYIRCLVNGIHFTLHKTSTKEDVKDFEKFQDDILLHEQLSIMYGMKSFRLFIHPRMSYPVKIYPFIWKRVEIKPWLEEGNCPLPKNETLYILNEAYK